MAFFEESCGGAGPSEEQSELAFFKELLRKKKPEKVVTSGEFPQAVITELQTLDCAVYLTDTLPDKLEEIGSGIDFLLLDGANRMPEELLDFIAAFPYLKRDAVVVVHNLVQRTGEGGRRIGSSILMRNVRARRIPHHLELYPGGLEQLEFGMKWLSSPRVPVCTLANVMAAFSLTADTSTYIGDLFSALYLPWTAVPGGERLEAYERIICTHYKAEYVQMYMDAVEKAERLSNPYENVIREMTDSLFASFPHVLLYGKGKYGRAFLKLVRKFHIRVDGFVVSDGRKAEGSFEGLPVYSYSQVPFPHADTLIIQTADAKAIERLLGASDFRWMKLPWEFWNVGERGDGG